MNFLKRIPVVKRLYPALLKHWALLSSCDGYKVQRYQGLLWLLNYRNFVDRQVGVFGGFEQAQVSYLLSQMSKADAFIDIGANFGLYTLQIAKSGRASEIHAFEPDPRNYAQLSGNLYLNKMTGQVKTHAFAVSDHGGALSFKMYPDTSTGQSRVSTEDGGTSLQAVTLDETFPWQGRNIFLKIDIEGHELAALKGGEKLLRANTCFLQVEIFPENIKPVQKFLNDAGYQQTHQIDQDYYFRKVIP